MKQQAAIHDHQSSYPVPGAVLEFNKVMVVVLNTLQLGSEKLEGIEERWAKFLGFILESPDLSPQCVRVSTEECH